MPIYEYACHGCGHQFEEWQKITDAPTRTCPSCGKRKVERLVSLSSFHLKGGGWYVTDYGGRKSGSSPSSNGDKGDKPSSGSGGSDEKKTGEKKSAGKSESKS